jgi:ethanolamine utilization cobalamin adenosyltransferase
MKKDLIMANLFINTILYINGKEMLKALNRLLSSIYFLINNKLIYSLEIH